MMTKLLPPKPQAALLQGLALDKRLQEELVRVNKRMDEIEQQSSNKMEAMKHQLESAQSAMDQL
jgi:hypothetical protein